MIGVEPQNQSSFHEYECHLFATSKPNTILRIKNKRDATSLLCFEGCRDSGPVLHAIGRIRDPSKSHRTIVPVGIMSPTIVLVNRTGTRFASEDRCVKSEIGSS